jgi:hypothetical protein
MRPELRPPGDSPNVISAGPEVSSPGQPQAAPSGPPEACQFGVRVHAPAATERAPSYYGVHVQLVIGGLITLTVTALVQILVIPWVQSRTRRRERWEENVTALEAILHDEYPGAIQEAYHAALYVLLHESDRREGDDESFAAAKERDYAASRTLSELEHRMMLLVRRIQLVRRDAPLWQTLNYRTSDFVGVVTELQLCTLVMAPGDVDALNGLRSKTMEQRDAVVHIFDQVAVPMRPPLPLRSRRLIGTRRTSPGSATSQRSGSPAGSDT